VKSSTSCRVCSRWLEGEYNRSTDFSQKIHLQALMARGYCDNANCVAMGVEHAAHMRLLWANAEDMLLGAIENDQAYTITRDDKPVAVLLPIAEYDELQRLFNWVNEIGEL